MAEKVGRFLSGSYVNSTHIVQYSLSPDPTLWGSNLSPNHAEPDDALHNPEIKNGKFVDPTTVSISSRGIANIGCLVILCVGLLALL